MHLSGVVPKEGGGAAAAVHTHVPPQMRGQVAQDHLRLARSASKSSSDVSTPTRRMYSD
jgi:hypothetical protein